MDKDIAEARGDLINSLRQQPNFLMQKYNEKIRVEKAKEMEKS